MNPGLFNKRIRFFVETATQNEYGGSVTTLTPLSNVSPDAKDGDHTATWGALEPIRQYHQFAIEAGASVMNGDRFLKIRKRASFYPTKDMVFQDISDPNNTNPDTYTIISVLPYWPGAKASFQNGQETAYHDQYFVWMLGVKRN